MAKVRRRATGLGSVMVFGFLGKRHLYLVRLGLEGKGGDGSSAPMGLARQSVWLALG
jgi:hypothetical protein